MLKSFCKDEVSSSLARCGPLDSDGARLFNDEHQSRGPPKVPTPPSVYGLQKINGYWNDHHRMFTLTP